MMSSSVVDVECTIPLPLQLLPHNAPISINVDVLHIISKAYKPIANAFSIYMLRGVRRGVLLVFLGLDSLHQLANYLELLHGGVLRPLPVQRELRARTVV